LKTITSKHNSTYKDWLSLLESKGIKHQERYLIYGDRVVREILNDPKTHRYLEACLFSAKTNAKHDDNPLDLPESLEAYELQSDLFKELDIFGTRSPILVSKFAPFSEWSKTSEPKGLELISSIGDPSNLGAVLRSAAAFGVEKVVLLKESAHPFHPKAVRAASGVQRLLRFSIGPSLTDLPSRRDIVALDMNGTYLSKFDWPESAYLLMGEEGLGIPDSLPFTRVAIPMTQEVESLNVAVATSIAFYSYRLKYRLY
jgi:TrmH family RNA methyltransferase